MAVAVPATEAAAAKPAAAAAAPAPAKAAAKADTTTVVDAALRRQGAKKEGLPVAQLPAVVAALQPNVVHQKPLTTAEEDRVKTKYNITGDHLSRGQLKAIADDATGLFFAMADANEDGEVTPEEYVAFARRDARGATANATAVNATIPSSVQVLFDKVAGPGAKSFNVTQADAAGIADGATALFLAADADGNGVITEEELSAPMPASTSDADGKLVWVPMAKHMDAGTVTRVYGKNNTLTKDQLAQLWADTSSASLSKNARPAFKLIASSLDANGDLSITESEVVPDDAEGDGAKKAREAFKRASKGKDTVNYDDAAAELDNYNKGQFDDRRKKFGAKRGEFDAASVQKAGDELPPQEGEPKLGLTKEAAEKAVARYDIAGKNGLDRVAATLWAQDNLPPRSAGAAGAAGRLVPVPRNATAPAPAADAPAGAVAAAPAPAAAA